MNFLDDRRQGLIGTIGIVAPLGALVFAAMLWLLNHRKN